MPCDYSEYPGNWEEIREEILARAENKCELCGAENGKPHWKTGSIVVLTIAHLDQDIENNARYNLRALCQRCHNIIDLPYRIKRRDEAKRKKDIREYREICNLISKEIYGDNDMDSLKEERREKEMENQSKTGMFFSKDGKEIYFIGNDKIISKYNLKKPFDYRTGSYDGRIGEISKKKLGGLIK